MTHEEWEDICDRCGKCCYFKRLELDGSVTYTTTPCFLFDEVTRLCRQYENRRQYVPECVKLTPENVKSLFWLPDTCKYRECNVTPPSEEEDLLNSFDDPCPDCGTQLKAKWSGAECPKCGYWFCL